MRHGPAAGPARNVTQGQTRVTAMIDRQKTETTYASAQFAEPPGDRWKRFLERVGTRSNDFGTRLSRARFVYLHRRETGSHWLPL
jgi:hypothetical protein